MSNRYDIAVIGCGAVGSAALYSASKLGLKTIGLDTFSPPHSYGSSHGESRIVRRAIGEDPLYSVLSARSYEIWEKIEKITGQKLLYKNGCLVLVPDNAPDQFFENTVNAACEHDLLHQIFNCNEIHKKFPEFSHLSNIKGCLEKEGGFVQPEHIIEVQLKLSQQNKATFSNAKISSIYEKNGGVHLITECGDTIFASKVLLSPGPWIPSFLPPELHPIFKVCRQILYWFDFKDSTHFNPAQFPVFILHLPNGSIYGFPALRGKKYGVKLSAHQLSLSTEQEKINREVSEEEIQGFYAAYLQNNFPNIILPKCLKTSVCSYTITPDEGFVVDFLPHHEHTLFISACSGHGFKHSAAMGELGINLLMKNSVLLDPSIFSLKKYKESSP